MERAMLKGLDFSVYKFVIKLSQTTYFGFKQRFDFIKYLQRTVKQSFPCNINDDCLKCKRLMEDGKVCDYPFLMGIFYSHDYKANLRKPFVLLPPLNKREVFHEGEELEFQLILIGKANKPYYLTKYFIPAFEMLGRFSGIGRGRGQFKKLYFGRYELERIYTLNDSDEFTEIFNQSSGISEWYLCTLYYHKRYSIDNLPETDISKETVGIGWRTPFKSDYKMPVSFLVFWSVIYQRLQPLNFFYGDETKGEVDEWNRLRELSKGIELVEDKDEFMIYKGNMEPFKPYMIMGSYLHVGALVSNGYGCYYLF